MTRGIVVGSGPNGLAGAVALAHAGVDVTVLEAADEIGGGTRTSELTIPGLLHDHCAAVLPFGVASPFLRSLGLERHGLRWRHPPVPIAHPLDRGRAAVLGRSVGETAERFGVDGPAYRRLFAGPTASFDDLLADVIEPVAHLPRHPLTLARFGARGLRSAMGVTRRFAGDPARALFAGLAAHSFRPLTSPTTASIGLLLGASAHAVGWPVAEGGTRAVTDALAAELLSHGGRIETGRRVRRFAEVDDADILLLDLAPGAAARLLAGRQPRRTARAYRRFRHGPAAFKLDLAVDGGVPWANDDCRHAGTVHVGGTADQIAAAELAVSQGRMPERPFVLVAQQYLADPTRSKGDVHPVWAYAHVPNGYAGDATDAILYQMERFAPGLRERIVAQSVRSPADLERANPNYVGGDISTGANDPLQVLFRPRIAFDPYATGVPGVYLCSAATPPGAGVHGMGGANAAASALLHLGR
jgi:phytoene dehydrogenase-like protein